MLKPIPCPICDGAALAHDVVDFNKSCEEPRGKFLPLSGIPIYYYLCESCRFCFAPEFSKWRIEDFENNIYNDEYATVDPDYEEDRPRANAELLTRLFADHASRVRHLDYGGGNGLLSELLVDAGWKSSSYDPFVNRGVKIDDLGKFELISAFEVFEHVPDPIQLMADVASLLKQDGVAIFSTLLSDGNIVPDQRLNWWYASPRNGHVSLFSAKSLSILGAKKGLRLTSISNGLHAYFRGAPDWARQVIGAA